MGHMNHSRSTQTIWHDACLECTERADRLPHSLGDLDDRNRIKAWHFMRAYRWSGGAVTADADPISQSDRLLFDCLYAIGVFIERAGFSPGEVEDRMIANYDELAATTAFAEPITKALNGIDITGIFVFESDG